MPRISEYFGIYVYMYFDDVGQHSLPHIHVRHGEHKAVYDIQNGDVLAGKLKTRQHKLVLT